MEHKNTPINGIFHQNILNTLIFEDVTENATDQYLLETPSAMEMESESELDIETLGNEVQNSNDLNVIENNGDVEMEYSTETIEPQTHLIEAQEIATNSSETGNRNIVVKQLKLDHFLVDHELQTNGICIYPYCGLKIDCTIESVKQHFRQHHNIEILRSRNEQQDDYIPFTKKNWMPMFLDKKDFFKSVMKFSKSNNSPSIFNEHFKKIINPYERHFNFEIDRNMLDTAADKASSDLRMIISRHVQKEIISLKINIITNNSTILLVISIHYFQEYDRYSPILGKSSAYTNSS